MKRKRISLNAAALVAAGLATSVAALAAVSQDVAETSPQVRYAQVQVRLAQLGLDRVDRLNHRVENVVPDTVVGEWRRDVDAAKQLLQGAEAGSPDAQFNYWLAHVRAASREFQSAWQRGQAANKRAPGAVDPLELERTRLRSEQFELLAAAGEKAAGQPPVERLAWQNQVLLAEVQSLHEAVFRTGKVAAVYYPYGRW